MGGCLSQGEVRILGSGGGWPILGWAVSHGALRIPSGLGFSDFSGRCGFSSHGAVRIFSGTFGVPDGWFVSVWFIMVFLSFGCFSCWFVCSPSDDDKVCGEVSGEVWDKGGDKVSGKGGASEVRVAARTCAGVGAGERSDDESLDC